MTIRLAIAEDQRMFRELLAAWLAQEPRVDVVGAAGSGREAIDLATNVLPDVLLMDIGPAGPAGIEVARALKKKLPEMKLVALSVHSDKYLVQQLLKAGADGYVVKSSALAELVRAIQAVVENKVYLSPDVARGALSDHLSADTDAHGGLLSAREQEVLALLAEGKRSVQIAAQLHISTATVEAHRAHIMRKLGLHTVADLTKYAIRRGLTSL
jgi:DNA-binding NarL/FixJ family response regulator